MHGSILAVTILLPGQSPRQVQPFGPRDGNCLQQSYPGGRGAGQIENNFCCSCEVHHFSVDMMAPDHVQKTAYFQGKSLEFVADWLETNNLSKLKSVLEGTFIINCCCCCF